VFNKTTKRGLTDIKGGCNQPPNSKLGEQEGESEDDRGIMGWGNTFGGGNRRRWRRGSRIELERSLNWTGSEKRRRPAAGGISVKGDGTASLCTPCTDRVAARTPRIHWIHGNGLDGLGLTGQYTRADQPLVVCSWSCRRHCWTRPSLATSIQPF
jgi:hypothetical protein